MSTIVMAACWPLQMPPTQKAVLMSLADNANDHGVCWPGIPTIAMRTCLGRTAVIEAIKELERAGLLTIDRDSGRANRYQLTPADDLFQPVRQADGSGRRTGPAGGPNPSGSRTTPVRQADPNRKEPSGTVKKEKRASAPTCPDDVSPQTWDDWLALRKAKRAPVTETVIRSARAEAGKAGLTFEQFLTVWCARGSQGLQADWLKPNERGSPPATASKTMGAIQRLQGMKHGNVAAQRDSGRSEQGALPAPGRDAAG